MKKTIRLTESDLTRIVKKVLMEQTDSKWKGLADRLENAMKGFGTDEDAIQEVIYINVKDKSSWDELQKAFDVRDGSNLMQWLESDLSGGELDKIKKHIVSVSTLDKSKRDPKSMYTKEVQNSFGLPVDGILGKDTKEAIKKIQNFAGVSVDGIMGKDTLKALKEKLEKNPYIKFAKSVGLITK